MNELRYDQLSNSNKSLKLVHMHAINNRGLSISTTMVKDSIVYQSLNQSLLIPKVNNPIFNRIIIFKDFMLYLIYEILEIPWFGIQKSLLRHDYLSSRSL